MLSENKLPVQKGFVERDFLLETWDMKRFVSNKIYSLFISLSYPKSIKINVLFITVLCDGWGARPLKSLLEEWGDGDEEPLGFGL